MNRNEAEVLAVHLMGKYNLAEWLFKFDQAKRRFGHCNHTHRTISLSAPLTELNERPEVEDTIRHEIAHALVGGRAGHGPVWKRMAIQVGARPERCYDMKVTEPKAPYKLVCSACGAQYPRYRRTRGTFIHPKDGAELLWFRGE